MEPPGVLDVAILRNDARELCCKIILQGEYGKPPFDPASNLGVGVVCRVFIHAQLLNGDIAALRAPNLMLRSAQLSVRCDINRDGHYDSVV